MNLNEKPSPSSELPTEFGQSVSDQLKSLVEDTRNVSIFKLSCHAEEETDYELSTSIIFCVTISYLLMSLILSSFVFITSAIQLLQSNTLLSRKHCYQMFMHTDCCLHFYIPWQPLKIVIS